MSLDDLMLNLKGGSGSGNFGHGGRKGKRGGSTSKGGGGISSSAPMSSNAKVKGPTSVKDIHNQLKKAASGGDPATVNSKMLGGMNTSWDGDQSVAIDNTLTSMGFNKTSSSTKRGEQRSWYTNGDYSVDVSSSKKGTHVRTVDEKKEKRGREDALSNTSIYD